MIEPMYLMRQSDQSRMLPFNNPLDEEGHVLATVRCSNVQQDEESKEDCAPDKVHTK